jgi:hypothetical protein
LTIAFTSFSSFIFSSLTYNVFSLGFISSVSFLIKITSSVFSLIFSFISLILSSFASS